MMLVLPNGARVGHRSMKIYYKQNLSIEDRSVRNNSARIQLLRLVNILKIPQVNSRW